MSLLRNGRRVTAGGGDLQCLGPMVSHSTALIFSECEKLTANLRTGSHPYTQFFWGYFGESNKSASACQMRRRAGQCTVLTTEKSPFIASLHLPVSLCRNGKMECVPEEKGNRPPPASGCGLSSPAVFFFFS